MFSLFGCGKTGHVMDGDGMVYAPSYAQISQDEARLMMQDDDGHVIVDVRRADESRMRALRTLRRRNCRTKIRPYWFIAAPGEGAKKHRGSWQTWGM